MGVETPQETLRSPVPSVDRHQDNVSLAAGSADMKARDFYAHIKDMDKKLVFPHSWYHNKFTVALFRPAPAFSSEKLPFIVNSLTPLEVGRTLSLSLHLEMFSHSQASPFYFFLYTLC